ncbi:MAG TPA: sporulation integral membrane protein YlbJ, partial [Clostridia bacterium]
MRTILIFIIAASVVFILSGMKKSRLIYIKKLFIPATISIFILCLILFSGTAVEAAKRGINLWLYIVFPSLFPFFVASELLGMTGFTKALGSLLEPVMRPLFNVPGCGSFAFAMGITSGYPVGAKITAQLREEKLISRLEAERLISFTNNSGPIFIIGAVATGMLQNSSTGIYLLVCHILSCISVGLLYRFYGGFEKKHYRNKNMSYMYHLRDFFKIIKDSSFKFGSLLGEAIRKSITSILAIGGFIIAFSVLISLLTQTGIIDMLTGILSVPLKAFCIPKEMISACISGFFEITTGASLASKSPVSFEAKLTAISLIIGWAGLSVHSQVISIISATDIRIKPYLIGKLLQGIFAAFYTYTGLIAIPGLRM